MNDNTVKRRNHEVPKGLLKNWLGTEGSKQGLHFIDLSNGQIRFEEGKNANFAITDYLYVPERENGKRDDDLENWFSIDEDGLARFVQNVASGSKKALNEKTHIQAIRACIALGNRSAYISHMTMRTFGALAGSPHSTAVDITLASIGHKFQQFRNWDFMILYDLPVSLVISERPFLDLTPRGFNMVSMALAPRILLLGTPPQNTSRAEMQIGIQKATSSHHRIAGMHNEASIAMARQWVVAGTRAELEVISPSFTPDKLSERMKTDRAIVGVRSTTGL